MALRKQPFGRYLLGGKLPLINATLLWNQVPFNLHGLHSMTDFFSLLKYFARLFVKKRYCHLVMFQLLPFYWILKIDNNPCIVQIVTCTHLERHYLSTVRSQRENSNQWKQHNCQHYVYTASEEWKEKNKRNNYFLHKISSKIKIWIKSLKIPLLFLGNPQIIIINK